MNSLIRAVVLVPLVALFAACGGGGSDDAENAANNKAAAQQAHTAYLAGINSNNLAQFLTTVTDDIVYIPPNSSPLNGKAVVGEWVKGYLEAYATVWEKQSLEFVVEGDLAYETYRYKSVDTARAAGPAAGTPVVIDTGNGINIYRRGADGVWRVSRDAWATDRPVPTN